MCEATASLFENVLPFSTAQEPLPPFEIHNRNWASEILARAHIDGKMHVIAQTFYVAGISAKTSAEILAEAANNTNGKDKLEKYRKNILDSTTIICAIIIHCGASCIFV